MVLLGMKRAAPVDREALIKSSFEGIPQVALKIRLASGSSPNRFPNKNSVFVIFSFFFFFFFYHFSGFRY